MQNDEQPQAEQSLASLTAQVASAYVSNNTISTADLGRLIAEIARQLRALGEEPQAPRPKSWRRRCQSAVPLAAIIWSASLAARSSGCSSAIWRASTILPHAYREMFGLKPDYPMVAPSYSEGRRELALKIGLGRPTKPTKEAPAPKEAAAKTRRTRAKAA